MTGSPFGRDAVDGRLQALLGKGVRSQERALAGLDARNILFVDIGDDDQRRRFADPEQHRAEFGDLAHLAILPQHDAGARRAQDVARKPRLLAGHERLELDEFAARPVERLLAGRVLLGEDGKAPQFLRGKRSRASSSASAACASVASRRASNVALGDLGALAIALLDDPLAHQRRHLRPDARLDDAAGIDDLRRIAPLGRRDGDLGGARTNQTAPARPAATSAAMIRRLRFTVCLPATALRRTGLACNRPTVGL